MKEVSCQLLQSDSKQIECPELEPKDVEEFTSKIDDEYLVQMIVDNLPVANRQLPDEDCGPPPAKEDLEVQPKTPKYTRPDGFPVGCRVPDGVDANKKSTYKYYLNNHITFVIYYHTRQNRQDEGNVIVGAEVYPTSIQHNDKSCQPNSWIPRDLPKLQLTKDTKKVPFSYSVIWKRSNVPWASRWDAYLKAGEFAENNKIHWFSIINSLMIVLFLTGMVAMIMMRVLHKDIVYYNRPDEEDPSDETGWKLVHGDVFRTPAASTLLSIYCGTGAQVFGMVVVTLVFALLGFLSPANRGSLMTVVLLLFVFMGIFAGYYAGRLYKTFGGQSWKWVAVGTAFMFPGTVFVIFFVMDLFMWLGAHSSAAIPFKSMLSLIGLWFGISVPLVLLGAYFGFNKPPIEFPVQTHRIPRQIPPQPVYMKAPISIMMGGILPFGAVFIELYFIMSSIWLHKFYLVFGFVFIVFSILLFTCAEITIVLIYFQLCNEDYRWWWKSYLSAGSSAVYLFLYSVFYYYTQLTVDSSLMSMLYFGYSFIISYFFFVLTGTVGFFASFWFVRKIYAAIKVE
jgi:transmembrane 9 superfamily protein 2/4